MAKLEKVFREEIARLAKKQIKSNSGEFNRRYQSVRKLIADQKKQIDELKTKLNVLEKRLDGAGVPESISKTVSEEKVKKARISPRLIKIQRKRLNLNQTKFARLVGVSLPTIRAWEQGRALPRGNNLAGFIAVRGLDIEEAYTRLGLELPPKPKRGRPKKKRRRKTRRTKVSLKKK